MAEEGAPVGESEELAAPEPAPEPSGGGGRLSRLARRLGKNKRALALGGIGGIAVALGIAGFLAILPLKLVHIRENLLGYFDKRPQHIVERRAARNYQAIFTRQGEFKGFKARSGRPITDAIVNFKTNRLANDMRRKGFETEFTAAGAIKGFRLPNGEFWDAGDTRVSTQRTQVRQALKELYPDMGIWRRGKRARLLYRRLGIQLRFFENTRTKLAESEVDLNNRLREKLRQRLFGLDSTTVTAKSEDEKAKTQAEKDQLAADKAAAQEFTGKIQTEAGQLRQEALSNPAKNFDLDVAQAAEEGTKQAVAGGLRGAVLGIVNTVGNACAVKSLLYSVLGSAKVLRALPLARFAGIVTTSADTIKDGQVQGRELNAFMKNFDGFEKSGGWQRITGHPGAAIKTGEKFNMTNRPIGQLAALDNSINSVPGTASTCRLATNVFVQIGGAVVSAVGGFFTGGGSKVAETAIGAAEGTAIQTLAVAVLEPLAIRQVAGMTLTGDETPEEKGDAMVAGQDWMSNRRSRLNGSRRLKTGERVQLDQEIALEESDQAKHQGLTRRWLDPHNSRSLIAKLIMQAPSTPRGAVAQIGSYLAAVNPFSQQQLAWAGKVGRQLVGPAYADDENDPAGFGVDQYGLTDQEVDEFDPVENEAVLLGISPTDPSPDQSHIETRLKQLSDKYGACFDSDNPEDYEKTVCGGQDEEARRYRIFRLDTGIMSGIYSFNNDDDDQGGGQ